MLKLRKSLLNNKYMSEIKKITEKIKKFRDDRDWKQFHSPKNLAIDISIEASEVLEHFQWRDKEESLEYAKKHKEEIADELADVAHSLFLLCDDLDINIIKAIEKKIKKNEKKYPIEKSKGNNTKYNKL